MGDNDVDDDEADADYFVSRNIIANQELTNLKDPPRTAVALWW